jgi:hypothetical protein
MTISVSAGPACLKNALGDLQLRPFLHNLCTFMKSQFSFLVLLSFRASGS